MKHQWPMAPTGTPGRRSSSFRLMLYKALEVEAGGGGPVGTVCWRRSRAGESFGTKGDTESGEGGVKKRRETSFANVPPGSASASP